MAEFRKRMRPLLGTYVEIGVPSDAYADERIDRAYAAIEDVHARLNRHDPSSELSRLNAAAGKTRTMSPLSVSMLRLTKALMRRSDGFFNCTVGSMSLGNAEDIEIHGREVRLAGAIQLTLDGIAKGFAVDLALRQLQLAGAGCGWVNAGGDLAVYGNLELPIWRRETNGDYRMAGRLKNAALATSNSCSTMHPFGDKVGEGVFSVLAKRAWLADALTKVAGVCKPAVRETTILHLGGMLMPLDERVSA